MKENTLSKVGDNPEEKDMNMIDQEDQDFICFGF